MNSTRLFALSALARGGPMHGYEIRRRAKLDRTERWTAVRAGSLYNALHRMAGEGLVRVVRTERAGNPPERTVYAITPEGREELVAQRDAALRDTRLHPDPVDLALSYIPDLAEEELAATLDARRQAIAAELGMREQEYRTAVPYLVGLEPMTFEHSMVRLRAELAWHDSLIEQLSKLLAHEPAARPRPTRPAPGHHATEPWRNP